LGFRTDWQNKVKELDAIEVRMSEISNILENA
jgi:hypothetical protein